MSEKTRERLAIEFAENRIKQCIANPMLVDDPVTTISALLWWDNFPAHQCYWNDRFAIAVMCGLDERQKIAAWCVVSNGINGYFEWETHYGYNMVEALCRLGILDDNFTSPHDPNNYYRHLSSDIAKAIVKKFDLPTMLFGYKQELTEEEKARRGRFNARYPYSEVL